MTSAKDAFIRGAKTGAAMSGLQNLEEAFGLRGAGRDPKGTCGSPDPFDLASGLENGRGYRTGNKPNRTSGGSGFSLGGFLKDVATGAIIGGLGSAAFYGVGKAVGLLKKSVVGRRSSTDVRYRQGKKVPVTEKTFEMALDPETYANAIAEKYGINLRGSGQKITIKYNPNLQPGRYGRTVRACPNVIEIGSDALISETELANTIAHELNHARDYLRGGTAEEPFAYSAGDALSDYINGGR